MDGFVDRREHALFEAAAGEIEGKCVFESVCKKRPARFHRPRSHAPGLIGMLFRDLLIWSFFDWEGRCALKNL